MALPSCEADEGRVLDLFIMSVFVSMDGRTTVHVWRTEDTLKEHLFLACGAQGSNSGCQAGPQEPSPSCQPQVHFDCNIRLPEKGIQET